MLERIAKNLFLLLILVFSYLPAFAADTTETWDVGATDVDFYTGFNGLGLSRSDQEIFGNILFGYGLIPDFSAYAGMDIHANGCLGNGETTFNLGVFGTPVDTTHFDLDLFLDFSSTGMKNFAVTPGLELNYDYMPELAKWGVYLRLNTPIHSNNKGNGIDVDMDTVVGVYWTIQPSHQILMEFNTTFHPGASIWVDIGGIAFGYNVDLYQWGNGCGIEMINQVSVDIPGSVEPWSGALMTGLIATLPSSK